MSWGQCENAELEKKETGQVIVAQIEILVVSFNKLCFSSATATQIIFFPPLPLSTRELCWVSEGTQGTLHGPITLSKTLKKSLQRTLGAQ